MSSERRKRMMIVAISAAVALAALGYVAFGGIGANLVYYWSPTELMEAGRKAQGADIRLGGLVEAGSVQRAADGLTLRFRVTDGTTTVPVYARAVPPAMFREGIGVVVEGTMGADGEFQTERLMVKHDNQYRPPGDTEDLDMKELLETMKIADG
ncbi:MAG: cytochrome c maturation protein CcmE [Thermoanaerobaculia bacterium]|nr:cytochrome c maturation protein CcmE [Thermoanaerobaculia bacterium]